MIFPDIYKEQRVALSRYLKRLTKPLTMMTTPKIHISTSNSFSIMSPKKIMTYKAIRYDSYEISSLFSQRYL